ncbi:hypothetical protein K0U07_03125 [bacterium]|nr:hypothetical protein [bacterium]
MMSIKELLFPSLCHRCLKRSKSKSFLCEECLVVFDLAPVDREENKDVAELFLGGMDFLYTKRKKYQELILSCALVQLHRLRWRVSEIHCEPELVYLKKGLCKNISLEGRMPLYLLHRRENPILLAPMKKHRLILYV